MGTTPQQPRVRTSLTAAAWIVIVAVCAFVAWRAADESGSNAAGGAEFEHRLMERLRVGLAGSSPGKTLKMGGREDLDGGSIVDRQRSVVVVAEVDGPAAAHAKLARLDAPARAAGGDAAAVERVLDDLYPASPPAEETQAARALCVSAADRALLVTQLGWCGRLALAPEGADAAERDAVTAGARRTVLAVFGIAGAYCTLLPVGLVLLIVALVIKAGGGLRSRLEAAPGQATFGAETFAAYLVLYVAGSQAARLVPYGSARWTLLLVAQAASLLALAAPVARGVPWSTLVRRVGLTAGGGVLREVGAGVVGWIAGLPIVAAGAVGSLLLQRLGGHGRTPGEGAHPIVPLLGGASADEAVLIAVAATVMAPIVEETMFRGVLYGHLRETTASWPRAASAFAGTVVVGLVFASIHPQGWTAVPVLASLSFAFTMVREWRGSLVAPMTMHAMTNGLTLLVVRLAMSN